MHTELPQHTTVWLR